VDSTFCLHKPKRVFQLFFPLSLVLPAQYPEKTFKPNRRAILLVSIMLGMGYGSAAEFIDRPAKTTDEFFAATRISVLAPECRNEESPMSTIEKALKDTMDRLEGKNIIGAMLNDVRAEEIPLRLHQR
jgi:hypothetical protein